MKYILASKSPRRRELLGKIVDDFEIIVKEVDETLPEGMHPRDGVVLLAEKKGEAVAKENEDAVVISSDTLVELDGIPLGKPTDEADAKRMLRTLSARTHSVHTGVAVHYMGKCLSGRDTAHVTFRPLTDKDVDDYVATGDPMDKAGAYGIQSLGRGLVEGYDGNFDAIVGLSLSLTERLIKEIIG